MAPFLWLWTTCFLGTASALEKYPKCDRSACVRRTTLRVPVCFLPLHHLISRENTLRQDTSDNKVTSCDIEVVVDLPLRLLPHYERVSAVTLPR